MAFFSEPEGCLPCFSEPECGLSLFSEPECGLSCFSEPEPWRFDDLSAAEASVMGQEPVLLAQSRPRLASVGKPKMRSKASAAPRPSRLCVVAKLPTKGKQAQRNTLQKRSESARYGERGAADNLCASSRKNARAKARQCTHQGTNAALTVAAPPKSCTERFGSERDHIPMTKKHKGWLRWSEGPVPIAMAPSRIRLAPAHSVTAYRSSMPLKCSCSRREE